MPRMRALGTGSLVMEVRVRAAEVAEAARRGSGVAEAILLLRKSLEELVEVVRGGAR